MSSLLPEISTPPAESVEEKARIDEQLRDIQRARAVAMVTGRDYIIF